jgi:hypothetical protein
LGAGFSGLKTYSGSDGLRGAEAPLFHGGGGRRRVLLSFFTPGGRGTVCPPISKLYPIL